MLIPFVFTFPSREASKASTLISSLPLLFPNLFLLSALSSSMGLNYHTGSLSTQSRERVPAEKLSPFQSARPLPSNGRVASILGELSM